MKGGTTMAVNLVAGLKPYTKAILAIVGALVSAIVTASQDGHVSDSEWVNVLILVVGVVTVYFGPNTPYGRYTKTVLAVATAVLVAAQSAITDGITQAETWQIVVAGLTAAGIFTFANKGATE